MDYTSLFYWLVVADNARDFFQVFMIVFSIISGIATLVFIFGREDSTDDFKCPPGGAGERAKKWMWWSYPFMIFFWASFIFTPSKKDALLIVAGGQTLNFLANDKSAKQIPAELSNFVLVEIKNMAKDAAVDLNINSQKDKILEKAKNMTAEELMVQMKSDTTFAKVILENK